MSEHSYIRQLERDRDELIEALRNMTASFRISLLLVDDAETLALGMSIVQNANSLLAKHAPKVAAG